MWNLIPNGTRTKDEFVRQYIRAHPSAERSTALAKYHKAMRCMFGMESVKRRRLLNEEEASQSNEFEAPDYVPEASCGSALIMLTDRCVRLPLWMATLVDSLPLRGPATYSGWVLQPVYVEPQGNARYILGVCGSTGEDRSYVLQHIRNNDNHPIFRHACPFEITVDLLTTIETDAARAGAGAGGEAVREFCNNPLYKIALLVVRAEIPSIFFGPRMFSHVRLLIKDGVDERGNLKLAITDPHGPYNTVAGEDLQTRVESYIRTESGSIVQHIEQHSDQSAEGSCGAVSFMRMLYLLYKAHTAQTQPSRPMLYIRSPIPCVFAVFVSWLFQRAGVITLATHEHSVRSVRDYLGDITLSELPPQTADRKAMQAYIVKEAVAQGYIERDLFHKNINQLFHRAFPDQVPLTRTEFLEVVQEIRKQATDFESIVATMKTDNDEASTYDWGEDEIDAAELLRLTEENIPSSSSFGKLIRPRRHR